MQREISKTGRAALILIGDELREGFSGQIVIDCNDGGVGNLVFSTRIAAKELLEWRRNPGPEEKKG